MNMKLLRRVMIYQHYFRLSNDGRTSKVCTVKDAQIYKRMRLWWSCTTFQYWSRYQVCSKPILAWPRKIMYAYLFQSFEIPHTPIYILRKSLPGLSLQRPTAPNVVASLKQGDVDDFDAGTRPKSQSSRSSASPRPLTSRASTTKLKVTFMLTNIYSVIYIIFINVLSTYEFPNLF